jgi:hypothetical protein
MRAIKTRTTIAALAAVAVLSTGATGVASAAVPEGALGETPTTVGPTTDPTGVPPAPHPVTTTEPPTLAPSGPSTAAQVINPKFIQKQKACQALRENYELHVGAAVQVDGNPDGQNASDDNAAAHDAAANDTRGMAQRMGCGWAA